jgi:hypothetical protein
MTGHSYRLRQLHHGRDQAQRAMTVTGSAHHAA